MKPAQAIQRAREVLRRQHKALSTEDCYLFWLRRYMAAIPKMPPELPSEKKLEQFLTDLALKHDVSASTQNQALQAVLFFYRVALEKAGRVCLSKLARLNHIIFEPRTVFVLVSLLHWFKKMMNE